MKIDIVYTWVDGSDPLWRKRKSEQMQKYGKVAPASNSEARFMDNQELRYSLRSIHQFAPWVNNIYIVTDNQVPLWLNTEHPQIHILDHKDIFTDTSGLPTYSGRGIETQLHHIEGLSEHFIYFNDDMFLGNDTTPDMFFIKPGVCRVFVSEIIPVPNKKAFDISFRPANRRNDHQHAIVNTRKLFREKLGKSIYSNIRHGVKPLLKSVLFELEELFEAEISRTSKNSFRTDDDILIQYLFEFYCLTKGFGKSKYLKTVSSKKSSSSIPFLKNTFTFGYINLHEEDAEVKLENIENNKPFIFCLNQTPQTPEENMQIVKNFMKEFYPNKSPFEKD